MQVAADKSSVRAKSKPDGDRKAVYRPVLGSPYSIQWPRLSTEKAEQIQTALLNLLHATQTEGQSMAEWRLGEHTRRRKQIKSDKLNKKAPNTTPIRPPELLNYMLVGINAVTSSLEFRSRSARWHLGDQSAEIEPIRKKIKIKHVQLESKGSESKFPPKTLHRPSFKYLQSNLKKTTQVDDEKVNKRQRITFHDVLESNSSKPTKTQCPPKPTKRIPEETTEEQCLVDIVFVCLGDFEAVSVLAHLPGLVATCNGVSTSLRTLVETEEESDLGELSIRRRKLLTRPVHLIPLPAGAEQKLADALGLRRASVVGLSMSAPGLEVISSLVLNIPTIEAPWLNPYILSRIQIGPVSHYVPTHIKHLLTTAPVNLKKAAADRKAAKQSKREKHEEDVYMAED